MAKKSEILRYMREVAVQYADPGSAQIEESGKYGLACDASEHFFIQEFVANPSRFATTFKRAYERALWRPNKIYRELAEQIAKVARYDW